MRCLGAGVSAGRGCFVCSCGDVDASMLRRQKKPQASVLIIFQRGPLFGRLAGPGAQRDLPIPASSSPALVIGRHHLTWLMWVLGFRTQSLVLARQGIF